MNEIYTHTLTLQPRFCRALPFWKRRFHPILPFHHPALPRLPLLCHTSAAIQPLSPDSARLLPPFCRRSPSSTQFCHGSARILPTFCRMSAGGEIWPVSQTFFVPLHRKSWATIERRRRWRRCGTSRGGCRSPWSSARPVGGRRRRRRRRCGEAWPRRRRFGGWTAVEDGRWTAGALCGRGRSRRRAGDVPPRKYSAALLHRVVVAVCSTSGGGPLARSGALWLACGRAVTWTGWWWVRDHVRASEEGERERERKKEGRRHRAVIGRRRLCAAVPCTCSPVRGILEMTWFWQGARALPRGEDGAEKVAPSVPASPRAVC